MLHKELDRLQYLDSLRYSAPRQPTTSIIPATLSESRDGRSCFTCGRTGHCCRYCPHKPRHGRDFQRERREVIDQRPARANRLARRQQRSVSGATYLPISIRGRSYDCLLDTGSDVTVIPASIAEGLQMKESSSKWYGDSSLGRSHIAIRVEELQEYYDWLSYRTRVRNHACLLYTSPSPRD